MASSWLAAWNRGAISFNPTGAGAATAGGLIVESTSFGQMVKTVPDSSNNDRATFQGGAINFHSAGVGGLPVSNSQFFGDTANNPTAGVTPSAASGDSSTNR